MTAALAFAAYLLIGQLADIGFDTIVDQLRDADPAWLIVGLLLAQATLIAQGFGARGGVGAAAAFSRASCSNRRSSSSTWTVRARLAESG